MRLNVNTAAVVRNTARLEKMHRSALPVAIRGALNNAAFDVKQKTMPAEAKKAFIQRQPNFFKANSKVEMAKGFNVKSMRATVGFVDGKLKGDQNFAVKDLKQQEYGGNIQGRALIPLKGARTGNSWERKTKSNARISDLPTLVDSKDATGKNDREKFIKSAVHAGKGGYVIGNRKKKAGRIVFKVRTLKRKRGNIVAVTDPMYSVEGKRNVKVKGKKFMGKASTTSAAKLEAYFNAQAVRQFNRVR